VLVLPHPLPVQEQDFGWLDATWKPLGFFLFYEKQNEIAHLKGVRVWQG
jgi:hypothetical protein